MSSPGRRNGAIDLGRTAPLDVRQDVRPSVGHDSFEGRSRLDPLPADHHRDVDPFGGHLREPTAQLDAFRRAGCIALDRLVDSSRWAEDAGGAHRGDCIVGSVRVTRHLYDVPGWGVGEVWARGGVIIHHELASEALQLEQSGAATVSMPAATGAWPGPAAAKPTTASPDGGARLPARTLAGKGAPVCDDFVADLCRRFVSHLSGMRTSYEGAPLDLDWATPLQRDLEAAARAIPWGEVVSYGALAALTGRPGAARAAGSFCAENRFPLIIPCHRVVAANGIGGYGAGGVELKRRLLALEGVRL